MFKREKKSLIKIYYINYIFNLASHSLFFYILSLSELSSACNNTMGVQNEIEKPYITKPELIGPFLLCFRSFSNIFLSVLRVFVVLFKVLQIFEYTHIHSIYVAKPSLHATFLLFLSLSLSLNI